MKQLSVRSFDSALGKKGTIFGEQKRYRTKLLFLTEGIQNVQEKIDGSCTMLLLTEKGLYAARDRLGRTPIVLGAKPGSYAAALETCAFPNVGYAITRYLGPGEIVCVTEDGVEQKKAPETKMQICAFLWVYY
jgi:amidophosphoribosyltransferase